MDQLIQLDHDFLIFLNRNIQNSFFDLIMPLIRNKYVWFPLYIGIISYIFNTYSLEKCSYLILFLVSSVAITDFASGQILKKTIKRERPCNDPRINNDVDFRVYCSHSYSFPSSHAANHFGLAMILTILFGKRKKFISYALFTWATIICFAQIYVGIHYPLDVIGGAILGILLIKIYATLIKPLIDKLENASSITTT